MEDCQCPQGNSQIKVHTEKCKFNPGWGRIFNDPDTALLKDKLIQDEYRVSTVLGFTDEDVRRKCQQYGIKGGVEDLIVQNLRGLRTITFQAPTNQGKNSSFWIFAMLVSSLNSNKKTKEKTFLILDFHQLNSKSSFLLLTISMQDLKNGTFPTLALILTRMKLQTFGKSMSQIRA